METFVKLNFFVFSDDIIFTFDQIVNYKPFPSHP